MPYSVKRPCANPRCPNLVASGYCDDHRTSRMAEGRETAAMRGYDRRHQKWRLMILRRDPICVMCKNAAATEADHIRPLARGGARLELANGQGLCKECHGRKTRDEQRA